MAIRKTPPKEFEEYLSEYKPCAYDPCCGVPVMWGFKIKKQLGKERLEELKKYGELECIGHGVTRQWCLITNKLSRKKAQELYGPKGPDVYGPRGGWKSVSFGEKRFISSVFKLKAKPYKTTYQGTYCNGIHYDRKGNIIEQ